MPVLERYGMTETLMNASNPYDGERRPGSVGFPLPGVEVKLAGDGEISVVADRKSTRLNSTAGRGTSEPRMTGSNPYDGDRRPGSVGSPLPGVEVKLAGDGEISVV